MLIKIDSIKINERKRELNEDKATELAYSIKEIGLTTPITIDESNNLIAGLHRIKAFEMLGYKEIEAYIMNISGLKQELAQIDENLIRYELHYIDRGDQLRRRKEIYEELYPETKHGGDRKSDDVKIKWQNLPLDSESFPNNNYPESFVDDTSHKTNWSGRKIREEIHISDKLNPEIKSKMIKMDATKRDALKIIKMSPEEQKEVIEKVEKKEAKNISHAVNDVVKEKIKNNSISQVPIPNDKYRAILIDPPWPITKIVREERPNQGTELDYQVMSIEEIEKLPIQELADKEGCHIYLWVTQKFLPDGLRFFEKWGVKYQCILTWVKPTGFTPFSWMYNTEHVLFGRIGSLQLQKLGIKLSFEAPITKHSEKPDIFYDIVKQASPEKRLEMFARTKRDGFDTWGNEI